MQFFIANSCKIDIGFEQIASKHKENLFHHSSSALSILQGDQICTDANLFDVTADWLVYGQKVRCGRLNFIKNITLIPSIEVVLMAGPISLYESNLLTATDNPNSETIFKIDDWIKIAVDREGAQLLFQLRLKFSKVLTRFLENHRMFQKTNEEMKIIDALTFAIQRGRSDRKKYKNQKSIGIE